MLVRAGRVPLASVCAPELVGHIPVNWVSLIPSVFKAA
jgi:hypothetical protein